MDTQALEVILDKLKERMDLLQEAVARGGCTSFDEYRFSCGQLRGLEAACMVIADLKQTMESSDE
jgi:hypothetical protein